MLAKGMAALITPHERLWVLGHRCTDQESLRPLNRGSGTVAYTAVYSRHLHRALGVAGHCIPTLVDHTLTRHTPRPHKELRCRDTVFVIQPFELRLNSGWGAVQS